MDLGDLLERISTGLTTLVRPSAPGRPRTAASVFRQADQCRQDGRYDESRRLLAEGLALQPNSGTGHLLTAYLALVDRDMAAARASFHRVLDLDPYHPRALLGLARIAFEEGDVESSKGFLGRALQYYQDFPDAKALRDMLDSWKPVTTPAPASPLEHTRAAASSRSSRPAIRSRRSPPSRRRRPRAMRGPVLRRSWRASPSRGSRASSKTASRRSTSSPACCATARQASGS